MHAQQMAGEGADAGAPMEGLPRATVASEPAPAQPPSPPAAPATSKGVIVCQTTVDDAD